MRWVSVAVAALIWFGSEPGWNKENQVTFIHLVSIGIDRKPSLGGGRIGFINFLRKRRVMMASIKHVINAANEQHSPFWLSFPSFGFFGSQNVTRADGHSDAYPY